MSLQELSHCDLFFTILREGYVLDVFITCILNIPAGLLRLTLN